MIVTCPGCEEKYRVPNDKVPPGGARMSCPRCQAEFLARLPDDPEPPPAGPTLEPIGSETSSAAIVPVTAPEPKSAAPRPNPFARRPPSPAAPEPPPPPSAAVASPEVAPFPAPPTAALHSFSPPVPPAASRESPPGVPPPLDLPPIPAPPPAPAGVFLEPGLPPAPPPSSIFEGGVREGGLDFDPLADDLFESPPPMPSAGFPAAAAPSPAALSPAAYLPAPESIPAGLASPRSLGGLGSVSTPPEELLAMLGGAAAGAGPPQPAGLDPFAALPERPVMPPTSPSAGEGDTAMAAFDDLFSDVAVRPPRPDDRPAAGSSPLAPPSSPADGLERSRAMPAAMASVADTAAIEPPASHQVSVRFISPEDGAIPARAAVPRSAVPPSPLVSVAAWGAVGFGTVVALTGFVLAAWTYGAPLDGVLLPVVERSLRVRPPYSSVGLDDETLPALEQAAGAARQASDLALEVSAWRRVLQKDATHADAQGRLQKLMSLLGERRSLETLSSP
ncbi:MAG: zinc-ribbon domain-containing protein [Myxococcota bacterium]